MRLLATHLKLVDRRCALEAIKGLARFALARTQGFCECDHRIRVKEMATASDGTQGQLLSLDGKFVRERDRRSVRRNGEVADSENLSWEKSRLRIAQKLDFELPRRFVRAERALPLVAVCLGYVNLAWLPVLGREPAAKDVELRTSPLRAFRKIPGVFQDENEFAVGARCGQRLRRPDRERASRRVG